MPLWPWITAWYALASLAALVAYWHDKRAAAHNAWRVRERTLHILEAVGGWPGALVAQRLLRHKTRDLKFQIVFWLIVAAHLALWTLWLVRRA